MPGMLLSRPGRGALVPAFALAFVFSLTTAQVARANSIASVVVAPDGSIYFSDYVRNRVWKVFPDGKLTVAVAGKHVHHLVVDQNGTLYGEHTQAGSGSEPSLWERTADGTVTETFRAVRHGQALTYPGSVFTIDPRGGLEFLRECQIVRLNAAGTPEAWAGRRCPGEVFKDAELRYAHLHGSFAWAANGVLLFSDARTVRRVLPDGSVTTLRGRPIGLFAPPHPEEIQFDHVMGLVVDPAGNIVVAERGSRSIRSIDGAGRVRTVFTLSFLASPTGLGISGSDLYVLTQLRAPTPGFLAGFVGNPTLRKITPDGRSTVVASPSGR